MVSSNTRVGSVPSSQGMWEKRLNFIPEPREIADRLSGVPDSANPQGEYVYAAHAADAIAGRTGPVYHDHQLNATFGRR